MRKIVTLTLLMIFLPCIATAEGGWHFFSSAKQTDPNAEYHKRYPGESQDDITPDQDINKVTLSADEQHEALVWGLSETEEKRYVLLMKNKSGVHYKNKDIPLSKY